MRMKYKLNKKIDDIEIIIDDAVKDKFIKTMGWTDKEWKLYTRKVDENERN